MYEVAIIGSGPSGLMAANVLKQANVSFILIEKNPIPGRKLLITGGGRCNVTNAYSKREFMDSLTVNKRFLYSALERFSTSEIISFFRDKGVELVLDKDFKYFPKSNKSFDVVSALTSDIMNNLALNEEVMHIQKKEVFEIQTNKRIILAKNVVVATGSTSYPKTGSTGFGLDIASHFDINTLPFYPAETSVYSSFIKKNKEDLQGLSFQNVTVTIPGTKHKSQGDILFTHFGLSGPSIQHISEYMYQELPHKKTVSFNTSHVKEEEIRQLFIDAKETNKTLQRVLEQLTVNRFAKFLLTSNQIPNTKVKETSKKIINRLIQLLTHYQVEIDRVEDVNNAYVNGGGVDTKELHPNSFEAKKVAGLFFVGETVDVHGPIGGFNITIACSMGHAAAQSIIQNVHK